MRALTASQVCSSVIAPSITVKVQTYRFAFTMDISIIHKICVVMYSAENATDENRQDLLSELNLMKNLEPHQNVIQLLGCVTKTGMIVFLRPCSRYLLILE